MADETQYVWGSSLDHSMMPRDTPIIAKRSWTEGFPVSEAALSKSRKQLFERASKLSKPAEIDAHLAVYLPEAVLVTSERKLSRVGGVVPGGSYPLLRGPTARLFERFDLGPGSRLLEVPVYEPDPSRDGTVAKGPYRLRERDDEGAWLALIVMTKRDTVSDEHCDPRALLSPASKNRTGKDFWQPEFVDLETVTMQRGLAFKPEALDGPPAWREERISNNHYYFGPELGAAFAELAAGYPNIKQDHKRPHFDGVYRYPVVEG